MEFLQLYREHIFEGIDRKTANQHLDSFIFI